MCSCRAQDVDKMTLGKQVCVDAWQRQAGSLAHLPEGAGMLRFEKGTADSPQRGKLHTRFAVYPTGVGTSNTVTICGGTRVL